MPGQASGLTRFLGYELDRARWQLRHGEEVLPLNRKTFDLLLYLVDNADRVVTKDELLRSLWPGSFIEESNLTQQVFLLRKALSRHAPEVKIIETVSGRGYRFAVPVQSDPPPDPLTDQHVDVRQSPGTTAVDPGAELSNQHHPAGQQGPAPQHNQPGSETAPDKQFINRSPYLGTAQQPGAVWLLGAAFLVTALLLALFLELRLKTRTHWTIGSYTQITHDGHAKSLGGTDGSRIYFTRLEKSSIAQVPIAGGAEALMPLALQDPWSGNVSPDGATLLIISQAGGQGPASSLWALELVGGSLRRLGNAITATWSPDGKQIVYASANGELFLTRRDGSDTHRIAAVAGSVSSIASSPDGHTIRFTRDGLLWQISPDGSDPHQLLPGWGKAPTQTNGEWGPDGAYFFTADGQIWLLEKEIQLWQRNPSPVQLTDGPTVWDRPVVTPDGRKLLASGRTNRGELVRFDPASGQSRLFLSGTSAEFVAYDATGQQMAYVTYPGGVLWRANANGSHPVQLTDAPVYAKSVRWAPDGKQIAFVDRTAETVAAVYTVDGEGAGKPRRLLPSDREAENDPSWSPDGQKLAFSTSPNVGASARSDLRVLDLKTGTTSLLPGSDGYLVPRWSPDGRYIAAITLDARGMRLLDLTTGRWSALDTGAVAFPEWSHDGKWIYYVRWTTDPAIVRIRPADGKHEVLADLTGVRYTGFYTLWMGLDPNDNPMMLRDAGTDDIYALTLKRD